MARAQAKRPANPSSRIATLKRRSEFQRLRRGARWATPTFVLEAKQRDDGHAERSEGLPRFGFTITRKVGGAVERNRIRRRLKAAVRNVQRDHARRNFDYVLIARRHALDAEFGELISALVTALRKVHRQDGRDSPPSNR